ncbi:hypothetical protein Pcinc_041925 [Petrolisthes cinctipes]|uniref:Uncharacterized protein n=1 Tax=Petrolisthes cinctipes TaxID=88211 RepID=A0AAE1EJB6_PETCI|nr:hypothetical protein Pcinc_041925 [Petrolisthes cinctipes]
MGKAGLGKGNRASGEFYPHQTHNPSLPTPFSLELSPTILKHATPFHPSRRVKHLCSFFLLNTLPTILIIPPLLPFLSLSYPTNPPTHPLTILNPSAPSHPSRRIERILSEAKTAEVGWVGEIRSICSLVTESRFDTHSPPTTD